jgi:hypothetical protein
MPLRARITGWLEQASPGVFSAYAIVASFSAYFCMYAFRRPFAVGTYAGDALYFGLDPKTTYLVAQVIGYAAAKFLGIKVVSELPADRRAVALVATIGCAQFALVLFAFSPPSIAPFALALNGLSLGMVWGMVFGFLEGRRTSDLLGAALCASFIVASGFVKTIGKQLLDAGIPEAWMPAATGALFAPAMLASILMLSCIPPPSEADERARSPRAPMTRAKRIAFFRRFAPGLVPLILAYVLLTAFRDIRDNFARELWDALGFGGQPSILTTTELPVAFGSLLAVFAGAGLVLVATLLHRAEVIGAVPWMVSVGLGLYLGYVPFNCVLFDRLVAATGSIATAGFLIYVADAAGYAGSVGLLVWKSLGHPTLAWVPFLEGFGIVSSLVVAALYAASAIYFARKTAAVPVEAAAIRP